MKNEFKIACPKCDWEPDGRPYWICDKCPTVWDTFSTFGKCPSCKNVHRYTLCISCRKISPHHKWYKNLDGPEIEELVEFMEPYQAIFPKQVPYILTFDDDAQACKMLFQPHCNKNETDNFP